MEKKVTQDMLMEALKEVPDPELGISIVDLGLVYDVTIDNDGDVRVLMTLTTMGCPLFELISGPIQQEIGALQGVRDVIVELTFDPPWTPEKMTEEGKVALGFF